MNKSSNLCIEILQRGQPEQERSLRTALEERVKEHTGGTATVSFECASIADCDLIVYLGNSDAASDSAIQQRITEAIANKTRILPLVENLENYSRDTPDSLHPINGERWSTAAQMAELVLRQLGMTNRDRRVFLSYRRKDSTEVALQLYEKLHQAGYVIFLDYFSVDRGLVIQDRIRQALHEMSFVLLLETEGAAGSKWVAEEEIGYTLNHRLGLLSLAWPEIEDAPAFPMLPPDRRIQLCKHDFGPDGRLAPEVLDRVMLRIEQEHADQLRARRERLVEDVAELLQAQGHHAVRLGDYSMIIPATESTSKKTGETVVRLCPRPTNHWDMFALGRECSRRANPPTAWVVGYPGGYSENVELTQWIGSIQMPKVSFFDPLDLPLAEAEEEQATT